MKKLNLIIIITVIIFSSCMKVLDFGGEGEENRKLVVNGVINNDSIIRVHISKSLGVLEEDTVLQFITDAKVKLFEDALFIENLQHDSLGFYYSTIIPEINKKYKIEVEKGTEKAIGETELSNPVPIELSNYTISEYFDTLTISNPTEHDTIVTNFFINMDLSITDPADENNYYIIEFYSKESVFENVWNYETGELEEIIYFGEKINKIGYSLYPENALLENSKIEISELYESDGYSSYYNGFTQIYSDKLFNGQTINFTIQVSVQVFELTPVYYKLYSLDKEYFDYLSSRSRYSEAKQNPLAEPVQIFSNIKNGYGIFSNFSIYTDSICF